MQFVSIYIVTYDDGNIYSVNLDYEEALADSMHLQRDGLHQGNLQTFKRKLPTI